MTTKKPTIVSLDIETIPDENKIDIFNKYNSPPEDIESKSGLVEWRIKAMSTTPEYCQIVGLNWMFPNGESQSVWLGQVINGKAITERGLLIKAGQLLCTPTVVVYNGLAFDIPAIMYRSMHLNIYGTSGPPYVLSDLKPWEKRVIDLMRKLFANRSWKGLKEVREHFIPKAIIPEEFRVIDDMKGDSVYELFAQRKFNELMLYGRYDAWTNMAVYKAGKGYWW